MTWVAVVLLVVLGLVAVALLTVAKRHEAAGEEEPDPLLILGITLAGAGSALIAAIGPAMIGLTLVGLAVLAAGIQRTRHRQPPSPRG